MKTRLDYWVVSDGPKDFPHHVVARRWMIFNTRPIETDDRILAGDVEGVERRLPPGLTFHAPGPEDDPRIVGAYL